MATGPGQPRQGAQIEGGAQGEAPGREEEPRRSRAVILAELRELIALHVRPEWRQETLGGLPVMGQLEMFR